MPQMSAGKATFEQRVARLEAMVKVCQTESCLRLYSYLVLFGSTTPAELRQRTETSNATVFRALSLLSRAGIVEREEDMDAADKRYRHRYFIARNLIDESKTVLTRQLRDHLESSGRTGLLDDFGECLTTLPMDLTNNVTDLLLSCCGDTSAEEGGGLRIVKTMAFRVDDVEDFGSILVLLNRLVEGFDSRRLSQKRDWRKPLKHPMMLSVDLIATEALVTDDSKRPPRKNDE